MRSSALQRVRRELTGGQEVPSSNLGTPTEAEPFVAVRGGSSRPRRVVELVAPNSMMERSATILSGTGCAAGALEDIQCRSQSDRGRARVDEDDLYIV